MLIDTHAHLTDERLLPELDKIVSEMDACGLEYIVTVGCDRKSSEDCEKISREFDRVYSTVGIHPHDSKDATADDYAFFERASSSDKCVAIGEIGLDYHYDLSPREVQKRVFVEQLELAYSLKLPVVVHLREAYGDMLGLLKENAAKLYYGSLIHCYSGSKEMLGEFLKLGAIISFGGSLTFKNARTALEVAAAVPDDSFVVETDCPYLTPEPYRGRTNYPKFVELPARKLAEIRGVPFEEICRVTTQNAKRFYGIK